MGYLGYYFAWFALSYLIRQPWLLVGLVALWLIRGFLPPPGAVLGALGRAGRLREQVRVNRGNITARRDLATIYLGLLRPRRALPLLEEGLALSPDDAELLYLYGVALQRAGRHEEGLARLLAALEKDQRLRHGHPYFVAGEALLALRRWDDAADAFERYLDFNGSDVAAHTNLARAYAGTGDLEAAKKWLFDGLRTWHGLPGALKRRQFGAFCGAQWTRVSLLKDPGAIAVALLLLALCFAAAGAAYPLVVSIFQPDPEAQLLTRVKQAARLCGSQRVGEFEGEYEASVPDQPTEDGASSLSIRRDRIVSGQMEYCLTKVLERKPKSLHAEAVLRLHRADGDTPKDAFGRAMPDELASAMLFDIRLDSGAELTRLRVAPVTHPLSAATLDLRRKP